MFKRWNPFAEVEALKREIDRVFDGYRPMGRGSYSAFLPGLASRQYPLLNLSENDEEYTVEALAPGIDPESLSVNVKGNQVTISGEKKAIQGVEKSSFHRCERNTGKFVRSIELDLAVDDEKVSAKYSNGMLVITLPKAESAKPKTVDVKIS